MADRYLVTARKYRPAVFSDLVAQDHVADTLKNALRMDRLAHAYLFSGPRGVGKTTAARILAKAINCETPLEERPDNAEPCCTCDSCQSFEDGRSLNIFEIDAASNNKVDDIRELRESVRIPPQGSQKKVYIIDEVHMLSNSAFNALLKTLEEPPPHVLFIFATTEPHKVLPTILSRCQRFDFRRIPVPRIVTRLRHICESEGITADEESLMLIARKGDGALRDALSAFDQAVSLCGETLTYSELAQALGVVDRDLFFDLVDHVANQNSGGVLQLVQRVMSTGYDLQEFLAGLTEHLRHLLVAHTLGPEALSDIAESARPRYVESSQRFSEADLLRLLMIVGDAETDVKQSSQPRLKLELALLNMAHLSRAGDLQQALNQLSTLEAHAEQGTLPTAAPVQESPSSGSQGETEGTASQPASAPPPTSDSTSQATGASQEQARGSTPSSASARSPEDSSSGSAEAEPSPSTEPSESGNAPASESTTSEPDTGTETEPTAEDLTARAAEPARTPRPDAASTAKDSPGTPDASASPKPTPEPTDAADPENEADAEDETDDEVSAPPDDSEDTTPAPPDDDAPDAPRSEPSSSKPASSEAPAGNDAGYHDLFNPPALSDDDSSSGDGAPQNTMQEASATGFSNPGPAVATEPDTGPALLQTLTDAWSQYVERVKDERKGVGSLLGEARPARCANGTLRLTVPKKLHRDTLMGCTDLLRTHLPDAVNDAVDRIEIDVQAPEPDAAPSSSSSDTPADPRAQMQALRAKYDGLNVLFTMFKAEPVW
ncbi:MAG: DNA polymerase III subunit gamma/tau [Longimonas sp.]|uniref:DNA polymerase III subunit gamma/tau n=1 Tax=Longimonas sp. TaxID=2039626 RepID=UPI003975C8EC